MKVYKLGQSIRFKKRLKRVQEGNRRFYKTEEVSPKLIKGIVVGVRMLNEGYITKEASFLNREELVYHATNSIRAFLIAYNLKSAPVLVHPDNIK